MQVAQQALSQRSSLRCNTASFRHKVGRPSTGIPFTTSRTRVTCEAAKKGKQAAQSKKKPDAKQSSSIASTKPAQLTPEAEPVESAAESRRTPTLTEPRPADLNQDASAVAAQPIESSAEPPTNGVSAAGSTDEQATSSYDEEVTPAAASSKAKDGLLSTEDIQRLSELKRQQQRGLLPDSNIIQGALQEVELITWPTPQKAFSDTLLVIAIVAATGVLLFGYNILLSQTAEWWYHTPHPDFLK